MAATITISSAAATTFTDEPVIVDQTGAGDPTFRLIDSGSRTYDLKIVDGTGQFQIFDVTANQARITVLSSGNVGFGTNSPTHPLTLRHTDDNSPAFTIISASDNNRSRWRANGTRRSGRYRRRSSDRPRGPLVGRVGTGMSR